MKEFSLGIDVPIDGIYLSAEIIELLSIIQCTNMDKLKQFAINGSKFAIKTK